MKEKGFFKKLAWLRMPPRLVLVVSLLLFYFLVSIAAKCLGRNARRAEARQMAINAFFARPILWIMGVRPVFGRFPSGESLRGALVISNHLSYLDILIYISTGLPLTFITSVEIKHTPVLGMITQTGGALFIERRASKRSRTQLADEIAEVQGSLRKGRAIMLFPEATTGNGEQVLPFKSAFLQALIRESSGQAQHEPSRIEMFVIQYLKIGKGRIRKSNRDRIFWYGGMTFFPHFFRLLTLPRIDVKVNALPGITSGDWKDRKSLAAHLHGVISRRFHRVR
ncbi:MAG: 1-acyl-sn-glycerol-3-phosphate acyltransferase [Spirochaetia bacterium]|nr:1-acyl-sn-glycerol-3-phosphate acyltransferase [Spirochaetia bacterium]